MAKTGNAVAKLAEKSKRNAINKRLGTYRAVITRSSSTYHEKVVAFEAHRRLIVDHAINLGCRVTDLDKEGKKQGVTFRGDGLPDDSIQAVKVAKVLTAEELAKAEEKAKAKAERYRAEMRDDWKPRRIGRRGLFSGCVYRPR